MAKHDPNMIIITDPYGRQKTILTNHLPKTPRFFGDGHKEQLDGLLTYQFATLASDPATVHLEAGNHVIVRNKDRKLMLFTIIRTREERRDGKYIRTVFAENAAVDDLYTHIVAGELLTAVSAKDAATKVLEGTGWKLGMIDYAGLQNIDLNEYPTALAALHKIRDTYGLEMEFTVNFVGTQVRERFVHLVKKRGNVSGKRFTYGKDLLGVTREVDRSDLATAIIPVGKADETGKRLTIEAFENFHDGYVSPKGQNWVGDDSALQQFGKNGKHLFKRLDLSSVDNEYELMKLAVEELRRSMKPRMTYEVSVLLLEQLTGYKHEKVRLGDTILVKDATFEPALAVQARVIEIYRSYTDPTKDSVVLGEFVPIIIDKNKQIEAIQNTINQNMSKWEQGGEVVYKNINEPALKDRTPDMLWLDLSKTPNVMRRWDAENKRWVNASATTAEEIGAETPKGAQDKADKAEEVAIAEAAEDAAIKAKQAEDNAVEKAEEMDESVKIELKSYVEGLTEEVEAAVKEHADQVAKDAELNAQIFTEGYAEKEFHYGNTPPEDTTQLWFDLSTNPNKIRRYDEASKTWVAASPTSPSDIGAASTQDALDAANKAREEAIKKAKEEAKAAQDAAIKEAKELDAAIKSEAERLSQAAEQSANDHTNSVTQQVEEALKQDSQEKANAALEEAKKLDAAIKSEAERLAKAAEDAAKGHTNSVTQQVEEALKQDSQNKADAAKEGALSEADNRILAAKQESAKDAQAKADAARDQAKKDAAADAQAKADAAREAAKKAAAEDAQTKANAARDQAKKDAATDAQAKADTAQKAATDRANTVEKDVKDFASNAGNITKGVLAAERLYGTTISGKNVNVIEINAANITTGLLDAARIKAGSISTDHIAANAVNASKIAAGSILADKIAADAISVEKIAAGAVTAVKIAANAVTADKIIAGAVNADKLAANSVNASKIVAGSVTAEKVAANAITADKVAANAITTDKLHVLAKSLVANTSITGNDSTGWGVSKHASSTIGLRGSANMGDVLVHGFTTADHDQPTLYNSNLFEVDPNQTYKFSIGMFLDKNPRDAAQYFGLNAYDKNMNEIPMQPLNPTNGALSGDPRTNVYFWSGKEVSGSWRSMEGYAVSSQSGGNEAPQGRNIQSSYRMHPATKYLRMRFYSGYYPTVKNVAMEVLWHSPSVSPVDSGTIIADRITAGTIDASKVNVKNINAANITTGGMSADRVTSGTIDARKISVIGLNAGNIVAGSINAATIDITNLKAQNITSGTLHADRIAAGSIAGTKIAANAIDAGKIAAGSITTDKIAAAGISADKITSGTIDARKITVIGINAGNIVSGTIDASKINVINLDASKITTGMLNVGGTQIAKGTDFMRKDWKPLRASIANSINENYLILGGTQAKEEYIYLPRFDLNGGGGEKVTLAYEYNVDANYSVLPEIFVLASKQTTEALIDSVNHDYVHVLSGSENPEDIGGGWKRVTKTFAIQNDIKSAVLRLDHNGSKDGKTSNYRYRRVMLNYGSVALTWSPHTEESIGIGAITADKIRAGAITTNKLTVGDFTNLCPNPTFDGGSREEWDRGTVVAATAAEVPKGKPAPTAHVFKQVERDSYCGQYFPVRSGERFWVEAAAATTTSKHEYGVGLQFQKADGTYIWNATARRKPTANWDLVGAEIIVPDGAVRARTFAQINATADFGAWYVTNIAVRRCVDSSLVVDGSIHAGKIAVNAVTADKIVANAVTADKIAANAVTAAKIAANSIDAGKIAAGSITTDKIAAAGITADKITSGVLDANRVQVKNLNASVITAGTMSADRITGGTINATNTNIINLKAQNIASGTINADNVAISNGRVTINKDGVTVTNAHFLVKDAITGLLHTTISATNLLYDHSFETLKADGAQIGGVYNVIAAATISANINDSFHKWARVGTPRMIDALSYDVPTEAAPYGLRAALVNQPNYVAQRFSATANKQYTISFHAGKPFGGLAAGAPRLIIEHMKDDAVVHSETKDFAVPNANVGEVVRFGHTITANAGIAGGRTTSIRVRFLTTNANWCVIDGVQAVVGNKAAPYDADDSLFKAGQGRVTMDMMDTRRVTVSQWLDTTQGYIRAKDIRGKYKDAPIIRDHENQNVTISALGNDLYLGYYDSKKVIVHNTTNFEVNSPETRINGSFLPQKGINIQGKNATGNAMDAAGNINTWGGNIKAQDGDVLTNWAVKAAGFTFMQHNTPIWAGEGTMWYGWQGSVLGLWIFASGSYRLIWENKWTAG